MFPAVLTVHAGAVATICTISVSPNALFKDPRRPLSVKRPGVDCAKTSAKIAWLIEASGLLTWSGEWLADIRRAGSAW